MKTPFTINGEPIFMPSGFHELTVDQYRKLGTLSDDDGLRFISILTGIKEDHLKGVDLTLIAPLCGWVFEDLNENTFEEMPVNYSPTIEGRVINLIEDPKLGTFAQKITASAMLQAIATNKASFVEVADTIFATYFLPIYFGEPFDSEVFAEWLPLIGALPVDVVFPYARAISQAIAKSEKANQQATPKSITNRHIEAGIQELYKFGDFATLDALAKGDPTKYAGIEALPWGVVLLKSQFDGTVQNFERTFNSLGK